MREGKILVVEDEILSALDLQRILAGQGYVALHTTTAEEAVAIAAGENPDVVLMDINIDGEMDGIQAAEKILRERGIPIIFMTGYSDEETMEKAKRIHPSAILSKPLDLSLLRSAITSALKKTSG